MADFKTVYSSTDGIPVRLEAAPRVTPKGQPYTHHRLVTANGRIGSAIVATNSKLDKVLIIESERSTGIFTIEFPRGFGDDTDSTPVATAIRELREETGLEADSASLMGFFSIDSSIYPQKIAGVHIEVESLLSSGITDGEAVRPRFISTNKIPKLIADGYICDSISLAIWAQYMSLNS